MKKNKPVEHELKILPEYYQQVMAGSKPFEIRRNDRDFKQGDNVTLNEHTGERYTGRRMFFSIGYVTDFEQKPGYVVFGLKTRFK